MKGLLLKDLLGFSNQGKLYVLIIAAYGVFSYLGKSVSMFAIMITLFGVMYVITAMALDEKFNWYKYALSMPVSRNDMVISKYLLGVVFTVITFVLNIIMNFVISPGDIAKAVYESLPFVGIAFVYLSVILPILFKFGVEKGRIPMLAAIFIPVILFVMIAKSNIQIDWLNEKLINSLIPFSPFVILIIMILSVLLSCKIFNKKEF